MFIYEHDLAKIFQNSQNLYMNAVFIRPTPGSFFLKSHMNPDSERYGSGGGYDHVIVDLAQSSEM